MRFILLFVGMSILKATGAPMPNYFVVLFLAAYALAGDVWSAITGNGL